MWDKMVMKCPPEYGWMCDHKGAVMSLVAQRLKRLSTLRETRVRSLGREDPLEREMATHSSTLAWKIPWTEEPARLQSMESLRVGHDWATSLHAKVGCVYVYNCDIFLLNWTFYKYVMTFFVSRHSFDLKSTLNFILYILMLSYNALSFLLEKLPSAYRGATREN